MFHVSISLLLSSTRPLAQCNAVANDQISVVHTDDGGLWLLNETTADIKLSPCELFGFGMGAYVPKAAGQVNALDCVSMPGALVLIFVFAPTFAEELLVAKVTSSSLGS